MEIAYRATDSARAVIDALGRTEDVRFSPSNRRLAIAAFNRGRIAVLDVDVLRSGGVTSLSLSGGTEIASSSLCYPHGLDFVDDETLVVASRKGDVAIFKLPPASRGLRELSPIRTLRAGTGSLLKSPGSVAVVARPDGLCELLVCDNDGDRVTRHVIDPRDGCSILENDVLLQKCTNLPDGVCVSGDRQWIAVSNHTTHSVLLYEWTTALNREARPDGILRGASYPHGIRFSADGRHILVADAGAPFVHIYARGDQGWRGARDPAVSIRVMDDQLFMRGRQNPQEGGPKGLDVDREMNVLVATSEQQPLLVLDMAAVLAAVPVASPVLDAGFELALLEQIEDLRASVARAQARVVKLKAKSRRSKAKAAQAKVRASLVLGGWPWRMTAPIGWLYAVFKRAN